MGKVDPIGSPHGSWDQRAHSITAQEGNLEIKLNAYRPPFTRCANTPPAARPVSSACQKIIDTMNIDNAETTFGARGVQGVRFELPMVLRDRESFFPFLSLRAHFVPVSPFRLIN